MKVIVRALLPVASMKVPQKISEGGYCNQQYALHKTDYPATTPNTLDQRVASVQRLQLAEAGALGGGTAARNELQAAELEFNELFGDYRDWANLKDVALGNKERINNLGLRASSGEARKASLPATPVMQEVSLVSTGCIEACCGTVAGATMYTYFVAYGDTEPDMEAFKFLCNDTRSKRKLSVEKGKRPWICMLATNSAGMSDYSTPMGLPMV